MRIAKMRAMMQTICCVVALVFMLSSFSHAAADPVIRVGTMAYYLGVPLQVIQDEKLDEKFGFSMEIINFPSGGPMAEALGAGQWDIGPIGAGGMIAVPTYNAKLIADVHFETDGAWIFARKDSDIVKAGHTLKDYPEVVGSADAVRGKTMLGTFGNISHYMGLDYARKFGLNLEDLNFLHMETSQVYTSFIAGNGDIACMGSPTAAYRLRDEGYPIIGGLRQQGVPQQDAILISDEFYTKHRDLCVRFMKAWYTAAAMLNADMEYEMEKVSKFYTENGRTDATPEGVRIECEFSSYIDPDNYGQKPTGKWMTGLVQFMVDTGSMGEEVITALKENIRPEIAEQALKELRAE